MLPFLQPPTHQSKHCPFPPSAMPTTRCFRYFTSLQVTDVQLRDRTSWSLTHKQTLFLFTGGSFRPIFPPYIDPHTILLKRGAPEGVEEEAAEHLHVAHKRRDPAVHLLLGAHLQGSKTFPLPSDNFTHNFSYSKQHFRTVFVTARARTVTRGGPAEANQTSFLSNDSQPQNTHLSPSSLSNPRAQALSLCFCRRHCFCFRCEREEKSPEESPVLNFPQVGLFSPLPEK